MSRFDEVKAAARQRDRNRCIFCDDDGLGRYSTPLSAHWLGRGRPRSVAASYITVCRLCREGLKQLGKDAKDRRWHRKAWDDKWDQLGRLAKGLEARNVLGVSPSAGPEAIEAAYRRLVMEHHPDRGGTAEQFRRVQEAYERLKPT